VLPGLGTVGVELPQAIVAAVRATSVRRETRLAVISKPSVSTGAFLDAEAHVIDTVVVSGDLRRDLYDQIGPASI
jgi:hypothetical protein